MSEIDVIDDPEASRKVLGFVPFENASEMVKAVEWLLACPVGDLGTRARVSVRLEAKGWGGYAKLVRFWREMPKDASPGSSSANDSIAVVISNNSD